MQGKYGFQNISCYCLSVISQNARSNRIISKHLMLLFIIYTAVFRQLLWHFKTSHVIVYLLMGVLHSGYIRFQNISCYCLSVLLSIRLPLHLYFKTSHVIVYQISVFCKMFLRLISKHLMLLFIFARSFRTYLFPRFQNISCYCLSTMYAVKKICIWNFKTSHVIVYLYYPYKFRSLEGFQNISCYCLSRTQICTEC